MSGEQRLEAVMLDEIEACAGHTKHQVCNCKRTAMSILQRMRMDPEMVRVWLQGADQIETRLQEIDAKIADGWVPESRPVADVVAAARRLVEGPPDV